MVVAVGIALDAQGWFGIPGIVYRSAEAVRLVVGRSAAITVEPHGAVALIAVDGSRVRLVDRQQTVIAAQAVAVGVGIGEDPRL